MDYDLFHKKYFVQPQPVQRFKFNGLNGITLFFADYELAVDYYSNVLGPPTYVEGDGTRGWQVGDTWLTLLQGKTGSPQNVEIVFVMKTPAEAERLQVAFIEAGGSGEPASDQLMYAPIRYCPVRDPFGTQILVICPLGTVEA